MTNSDGQIITKPRKQSPMHNLRGRIFGKIIYNQRKKLGYNVNKKQFSDPHYKLIRQNVSQPGILNKGVATKILLKNQGKIIKNRMKDKLKNDFNSDKRRFNNLKGFIKTTHQQKSSYPWE